jgi:cell division protein FtsI/penicillin-binding protein 2
VRARIHPFGLLTVLAIALAAGSGVPIVGASSDTRAGDRPALADLTRVNPDPGTGRVPAAELRAGPAARTDLPVRVLDRSGAELMTEQPVAEVVIEPGADPEAVAAALAPLRAAVPAATLQANLDAAQGKPVVAAVLRADDPDDIRAALAALPHVALVPRTRLLPVDRALTSPALSGLSDLWLRHADLLAGWATTPQPVADAPAVPPPAADAATESAPPVPPVPVSAPASTADITSTIDPDLQRLANEALQPVATPAAMVVLQPSTGDVLAVAQNALADVQGPIALTGLYPPGSTFKIVTVSAALQNGLAAPDTVVGCPAFHVMGERRIPNFENFDLGEVPLRTAFAKSCNTTMAGLAEHLPPDALTDTAAQLGLGLDYVVPGLTTVTGSVPRAEGTALRVEEGIGQGLVTASPFGMALVAAALARGGRIAPALIAGKPGVPDRDPADLPPAIADQLRAMMRETVLAGTGVRLRDVPDLLGKTGTAEYLDDRPAHGWFVGIDGDLALAVFVADAGTAAPALDVAGRFLRPLP